jgi:GT2 family glycosyltransferase
LRVSVIIPVWNNERDLPSQLAALAAQEWPADSEVVVVDNDSTDRSVEVAAALADHLPSLRIVLERAERGPAAARNRGIAEACGEALLFLDADDEVAPGYVMAMVRALESSTFVAARLDCVSLNPEWTLEARPPYQQDRLGRPWGMYPCAIGGSLGVRRELLDRHGGFDPTLAVADDVDLCWRLQQAGHSLTLVPDAVVRYRYRVTIREFFRQGRGYGKSGPLLYRKHRRNGLTRRPLSTVARFWFQPMAAIVRARTRGDFVRVVFLLGFRIGMLEGCWGGRVLFL